ncbi:acetaldehyde dehydrogenase (acetylating) [Clostridium tagluense]|uniref:acetaldehyde dehydrogenase (acetylating) n=1 Tax=Clostridium tagluense TaxID=360422 RepID=UPI001C0C48F8|nr:acetaldehyde dehydrogenase (acetylating) [Clostridium tagluense]MBU3128284.1 acetaldehyde dehydrogenase (acetylating) [Clostridium tagluense]MCB2296428.1 acetaldehyde dehydrogenase (acetylating) [Clostridium tagluense]MCB2310769.1 acetaldehyde dehydrogenase (acetylating) [Clostridium tagluense]MCB2315501.1 acetaldehyde dehydrogenase (acetylating) [Clostridium tagluense]MCB2320354.1 acetaldehyde dehydrogenase (acetylating) [Clostridium tagluense]
MENFDKDLRSIQEARNLARLGKIATEQIADYTQEQIDKILCNMVRVAEENVVCLAKMAVEETGFGKVEDKAYKNHMASTIVYNAIKDMKTIGVISENVADRVTDIAEPVGLIMGIVPSTNPTSTAIYKAIIAIKSRNAIVFSPHPAALKCTLKAITLMNDAAVAAGAPANIISGMSTLSVGATNELMKCSEVSMIIATGGPGMVKAAYSAGKPALGVGAGNSPAYIERSANVAQAVKNIIASKTFDYGTICASEQSIIVEECNHDQVVYEFKKQGGYFMTSEETAKVCGLLFKNGGHSMSAKFVGKSPQVIATAAGISIPEGTKVLIGEQQGVGDAYPLSFEKLTTVLAFYTVRDWHEACDLSIKLLQNGIGHTMSIHTEDKGIVMKFAKKPAARILVNTGGTQGGTGLSTGLLPAFTLGCGTWGGSSVSENVGPMHLINIKRVAYGIKDCSTLASEDPAFNHPELSSSYVKQDVGCSTSPDSYASKDASTDNEKLLKLVSDLVNAMKGAN